MVTLPNIVRSRLLQISTQLLAFFRFVIDARNFFNIFIVVKDNSECSERVLYKISPIFTFDARNQIYVVSDFAKRGTSCFGNISLTTRMRTKFGKLMHNIIYTLTCCQCKYIRVVRKKAKEYISTLDTNALYIPSH